MTSEAMETAFARVQRLVAAAALPDVSRGTSYGTPALKVRERSFVRMKDEATLVLLCPLEQKDLLMEIDPAIYFQTEHYAGWPAVLIRLRAIGDEVLQLRLIASWRHRAPKKLAAVFAAKLNRPE